MAQGRITPLSEMTGKMSKLERQTRAEIEAKVKSVPRTKPKPIMTISQLEKKLFNKLTRLNDNFTEADSISLTMLTKSVYRIGLLSERLEELDPMDERAVELEKRIQAYERSVAAHTKDLCIPLSARLRLNNEMAKLMIEEKKLANMETQNMPAVNPLLALLEDDDDE